MNKKVALVTGGLGFVGIHLIRDLVFKGFDVVCLDNKFTSQTDTIDDLQNVRYVYADTSEIDRVMSKIDVDIVFHLGEYSRIATSFDDIDLVYRLNCEGTYRVCRFCVDRGVKLIYAASSSKFGDPLNQHLSPYAWYKAKNVELIKNFASWFGLDYSIAYFYNVFGDGQICRGRYATVIGIFIDQWLRNEPLTVVYPGYQRRDFTHVSDIVSGIVALVDRGSCSEFQFGTGTNYSLIEIARAFEHPYVFIPARQGERNSSLADEGGSIESIGWKTTIDVLDYIKHFISTHEKK
jgi:UDP-glucose 4-epimerase